MLHISGVTCPVASARGTPITSFSNAHTACSRQAAVVAVHRTRVERQRGQSFLEALDLGA